MQPRIELQIGKRGMCEKRLGEFEIEHLARRRAMRAQVTQQHGFRNAAPIGEDLDRRLAHCFFPGFAGSFGVSSEARSSALTKPLLAAQLVSLRSGAGGESLSANRASSGASRGKRGERGERDERARPAL